MSGFFITFEGGEGAGKTTQIGKLQSFLEARGHEVLSTREPGGTPEGDKIRSLIVEAEPGKWTPVAECLLMLAARDMHWTWVIRPALDAGKVVICDRFSDSTLAYQGYGHGLGRERVAGIMNAALAPCRPDLTILLDIEVEAGLKRAQARHDAAKTKQENLQDRYERMDATFHERVRSGFLSLAEMEPARFVVINAGEAQDVIARKIEKEVLVRLPARAKG